ncbi:MAG TPA: M28 family metallopeptidase [Steroidobacteraceae bacterium]|nr:M28 family metallopeptidase [Steroidobacteraceae bacterium]
MDHAHFRTASPRPTGLALALLGLAAWHAPVFADTHTSPAAAGEVGGRPGAGRFSEASYRKHIEVLASDAFEGRAPGTEGERKTVEYIEQQFKAAGLEGAIDGSFRQAVPVAEITPHAEGVFRVNGGAGRSLELRTLDDVVFWTKRPVPESRIREAGIVYAGYGIVAPEYGWNDYAGLDVRGKLVLALVNDPGYATQDPKLFTGNAMTYYGRWDYKFAEAVRQGAAGVLVIHETRAAGYPWDVPRNGATKVQFDLRIDDWESQRLPIEGWITEEAASRVLALAGQDFASLKAASAKRGFVGKALGLAASAGVANEVKYKTSYNVVGMLRGQQRPGEAFVYTAHWDHMGTAADAKPGNDAIFNGAQDNATGISGLIELARVFAQTTPRPERSLLFVAVTAEESGLLGSEYFVEHPPVPVARMVGGLNMDNLYAVGRTRDLTVIGFGKSELEDDLRRAAEKQGRVLIQEPSPEKGFYYRSDHFNLARKGVPMLYTKAGVDSPTRGADWGKRWLEDYTANRYHKPSDEYDPGWDVSGTLLDLQLYYDVGLAIANSQRWPNWREGTEFRAIREASRRQ